MYQSPKVTVHVMNDSFCLFQRGACKLDVRSMVQFRDTLSDAFRKKWGVV